MPASRNLLSSTGSDLRKHTCKILQKFGKSGGLVKWLMDSDCLLVLWLTFQLSTSDDMAATETLMNECSLNSNDDSLTQPFLCSYLY